MYVIKVGDYYVRNFDIELNEIGLSQEIMRSFPERIAEVIAKKINGVIILINDEEVSCE